MVHLMHAARQEKYFLLMLFTIGLLARLLFFDLFLRDNPIRLGFDAGHYHNVAVNMAEGKGFVTENNQPYFYRVPGYPLFLATCYKIFGVDAEKALWVQIIFASIIPLLMFLLSLACFPSRPLVAKWVGCLAVMHPGLLIFSGLVMTETFFMIMFLLFLILFMHTLFFSTSHRQPYDLVLAGFFLGCASLIRPVGLAITLFACCAVFFISAQRLKNMMALFGGWLFIIGIWLVRNFLLTGCLFLSTLSGPHCINHGAVRVMMASKSCDWQEAQHMIQADLAVTYKLLQERYGRPLHEIEICTAAESYALGVLRQYPCQTIKLCLLNMFKTVFSLYSSELLCIDSGGSLPPYQAGRSIKDMVMRFLCPEVKNKNIIGVIYAELIINFFILLGLLGFFIRLISGWLRGQNRHSPQDYPRDARMIMVMLGFAIIFVGLSSLCGFARLRLPIEPFFIMLSLMFWIKRPGQRERKS